MFNVKLYADGARIEEISTLSRDENISGFTTNPTLMNAAGIEDYVEFATSALSVIGQKPISFEVFSDEPDEMRSQALILSSLGENVYVKIPVTNTKGIFMGPLITDLSNNGVKLNITAVFSIQQVKDVVESLRASNLDTPSVVSVFAGRIADTGVDPVPHMKSAVEIVRSISKCELLWASPREVLNVIQANECGCDIITATPAILKKLHTSYMKDLDQFSLETVKMFYDDAKSAGYKI
jgi:transaldolase